VVTIETFRSRRAHMQPWERRLADLAHILANCEATYFEPELFRRNANHFLQTARTVTFLIQKNKADIPAGDKWLDEHMREPWRADQRMRWAVESRNTIEKVGDLELHSVLDITLMAGYLEEEDVRIEVATDELLGANVRSLVRFAKAKMPSAVADNSMIRIERRWIANTLPDWELLSAFAYIFARHFEMCRQLSNYLQSPFPAAITVPASLDSSGNRARHVHYVMVRDGAVGHVTTERMSTDLTAFKPPAELRDFLDGRVGEGWPQSLEDLIDYHSGMAETTFRVHGNHMPMLFLYDADFKPVDYVTTNFEERRDKYLFWRSIASRVLILKPKVLIWVCEGWTRKKQFDKSFSHEDMLRSMGNIDDIPITGEFLGMSVVTDDGRIRERHWVIARDKSTEKASLVAPTEDSLIASEDVPNYLAPVLRALEVLRNDRK
jgi:hypothetical protein